VSGAGTVGGTGDRPEPGTRPEPKVPYRQVSGPESPPPAPGPPPASTGPKSSGTTATGPGTKATGTKFPDTKAPGTKAPDTKATGPKVPYRQVSGSEGPAPAEPGEPVRRTPGSAGTGSRVTVTVDDAHLGDVEGLAERLRAEGLEVDEVLGDIGIITGSVPDDRRSSIGGVEGVDAVEEEATFQLPSPEAGIQ